MARTVGLLLGLDVGGLVAPVIDGLLLGCIVGPVGDHVGVIVVGGAGDFDGDPVGAVVCSVGLTEGRDVGVPRAKMSAPVSAKLYQRMSRSTPTKRPLPP